MNIKSLFKRSSAAILALLSIVSPIQAATAGGAAVRVAPARQLLFRVRGPNGATVYLLGSVHLLTKETGKLSAEIDSAFARARTVAFETSIDSVQLRAQELFAKGRYAPGTSLKESLSPEGRTKADSLLRLYGLTLEQVDQFKPWFVSIILSQMVMQKANFQSQYGVDMQLNERAKAMKKPVIGLESVDFQLNLFDSIDPVDQERMITTNKGPASSAHELEKIKNAWLSGDLARLEEVLEESRTESPRMMEIMLNRRNHSWMPKLEELIKGKDDALVVVGAAHLAGKNGVIELLKAKGYTIERM